MQCVLAKESFTFMQPSGLGSKESIASLNVYLEWVGGRGEEGGREVGGEGGGGRGIWSKVHSYRE